MKINQWLYRKAAFAFLVFFAITIFGFWPTYFSRLDEQMNIRMHLHGIIMVLWCLMLIAQAFLIRYQLFKIHRWVGKSSFVVMMLMVVSTLSLLHFRISQNQQLNEGSYYFIALVLNALIVVLVFYGLAIYFRKKPTIHARYMLATVFPMFTPVTDRIIHVNFPTLLQYAPLINNTPVVPVFGFALAGIIVIGLIIWDWRSHRKYKVFLTVLLYLLLLDFSVLNFHKYTFWQRFSDWLMTMPLS